MQWQIVSSSKDCLWKEPLLQIKSREHGPSVHFVFSVKA